MIFEFIPDSGPSNTPKDSVTKIQFGDGYAQRQAIGINSHSEDWSFTFNNRGETEGKAIVAFLSARKGVEAFEFTPPGSAVEKKYVCESGQWSYRITNGNLYQISAKFTEVFEP